MERLMRILVVEDNPHHVESAKKLLAGVANLDFVGNYRDFLTKIWGKPFQYDGVLSDVFFPTGALSYRSIPTEDKYKDYVVPAGVGVYFLCHMWNVPCVLVTAGHHHGKDYEWVSLTVGNVPKNRYVPALVDVRMAGSIGTGELDGEAPEKDWVEGFDTLSEIIKGKLPE